jgi:hypothetical protein
MQLNTELLAQAARDPRLAHGSVRLLLLVQTSEPAKNNRWHSYAEQLGVCSTAPWRKQLLENGYIPASNPGHRFYGRQDTNAPVHAHA